jgi:hypothetical protein
MGSLNLSTGLKTNNIVPGLDPSPLEDERPAVSFTPHPTKTYEVTISEIDITSPRTTDPFSGNNELEPAPQINTLVLNPSFITTDFDLLRFKAAAYEQLPRVSSTTNITSEHNDRTPSDSPAYSTNLISSPYNNPGHYLDVSHLPSSSRLFALALTALQPTCPDYATAPYTSALNFPGVLSVLRRLIAAEGAGYTWRTTSFYVVIFRSKLKEGIDNDWLYKLDYESHGEACQSGGLLKYWFGKSDGERRNLATCKLYLPILISFKSRFRP